MTRDAILAEALTWEGTPYHSQACVKGVGVDCAMLLVGIAKALGVLAPDWRCPVYSPEWHWHQRRELLLETVQALGCQPVPTVAEALPGDVLAFRQTTRHRTLAVGHLGLLLPDGYLLHARYGAWVQRHRLAGRWGQELDAAFTLPGIIP